MAVGQASPHIVVSEAFRAVRALDGCERHGTVPHHDKAKHRYRRHPAMKTGPKPNRAETSLQQPDITSATQSAKAVAQALVQLAIGSLSSSGGGTASGGPSSPSGSIGTSVFSAYP